jgi:large subunit ribosomal protein L23
MKNLLLIKRPLVTEKATLMNEDLNKYVFEVDINANKIEIAKAIEEKFNVKVDNVRTIRMKGKTKTQFTKKGRSVGKRPDRKKAIVTLKEGFTLDLFQNV